MVSKKIVIFLLILLASPISAYATKINATDVSDVYAVLSMPNTNYGSDIFMRFYNNVPYRDYLTFNFSMPTNMTINNASLNFITTGTGFNTKAELHEVYAIFNETSITWNNQPCNNTLYEFGFGLNSSCNNTNITTTQINDSSKNTIDITLNFNKAYEDNKTYISLLLIQENESISGSSWWNNFPSKDCDGSYGCNPLEKPYLEIEYCNQNSYIYTDWSICSNYSQSRNKTDDCGGVVIENNSCYSGNTTRTYCYDNDTLINGNVIIYDNIEHSYSKPTYCTYGCDNVSFSCNPPQYQQDLYNVLTIAIIIAFFMVLFHFIRK